MKHKVEIYRVDKITKVEMPIMVMELEDSDIEEMAVKKYRDLHTVYDAEYGYFSILRETIINN